MNKIRVLLVTGSYPPMRCGVGDYTERLARALADHCGIELQVLTSWSPRSDGDPPWVCRVMTSWKLDGVGHLLNTVKAFQPDIIHVQYPTQGYRVATAPGLLLLAARLRSAIPVIATWHEYPPLSFTRGLLCMQAFAALARGIIVVRPEYRVRGLLAMLVSKAPIRFIPNASVIPKVSLSESERTALRASLNCGGRQVVSFFGFSYPHKGADQLFEFADPDHHHLVFIGDLLPDDSYHQSLLRLAASNRWRGHTTVTGFVDPGTAARLLAASDAAVFPFTEGGGDWNSSLHAAMIQGTFVMTTSTSVHGYVPERNIYYAQPCNLDDLRAALRQYAGTRLPEGQGESDDPWKKIAAEHVELYNAVLGKA